MYPNIKHCVYIQLFVFNILHLSCPVRLHNAQTGYYFCAVFVPLTVSSAGYQNTEFDFDIYSDCKLQQ